MLKVLGIAAAAATMWTSGGSAPAREDGVAGEIDVATLLTAARGAPPVICSMASQALYNGNFGGRGDAPVTPLDPVSIRRKDGRRLGLSDSEVQQLLQSLSSDDACVRELSVRLLGHEDENAAVREGLLSRLRDNNPRMREIAALGLGQVEGREVVQPLIDALRDGEVGVRANAAWALGRIEDGRALRPITGLFGDRSEVVRRAAVYAAGHFDDSTSSISALTRVLRDDESSEVRRAAAWALGQLEARESVDALTGVLGRERDARVREMVVWALGQIEDKRATSSLVNAMRNDSDDRVREVATWAIGQIEDRGAADALGEVASGDKSERVRGTAAWALGQMEGGSGDKAPAGLLRALRDESDDVRLKAAWALGQIGDAGAISAIREALKQEKNQRVSRAMIRALIKSGEENEAALTELLNSSDPEVREAAVRGLAGQNSFNPWPWPWPRPRPMP